MLKPVKILCEVCGSPATAVMGDYVDATGKTIHWPKSTVKDDGIHFTITCPKCGERDQLIATRTSDVPRE
jgi:hypothetical protein